MENINMEKLIWDWKYDEEYKRTHKIFDEILKNESV